MTTTRTLALATAAALLACGLGACSRSQPDADPVDNRPMLPAETPVPLPTATPDASIPTPAAPPAINANAAGADTAAEATPAAPPAPDEQMMDDASATGMTARASRGGHAAEEEPAAGQPETK